MPYKIYGGLSFYQRKEIKDVIAYFRLVVNPNDEEAFKRIINYPARGIGDTTVGKIISAATENGVSLWAALCEPLSYGLNINKGTHGKLQGFRELIEGFMAGQADKNAYEIGTDIIRQSGIINDVCQDTSPENLSRKENIEELVNGMNDFCALRQEEGNPNISLTDFLSEIALLTDQDSDKADDGEKITLMTVHSAKGLEYKFVYIVGLEENLFPSQRAVESPDGFEEERRLFYVALTRAKELATLSYAEMRFKWGNMEFSRPSCFLREIDSRYLETDAMQEEREPVRRSAGRGEGSSALDELRRRFDYRYQQKPAAGGSQAGARFGGGSSAGVKSEAQRPVVVQPTRSTAGMRSVGVRQGESSLVEGAAPVSCGDYAVGDRVSHLKFGAGVIRRIETLASDHKLVVEFSGYGEKTLLAKFAKLTKL